MSDNTNTYTYDPTDEYSELVDSGWIYGLGAYRRKAIDAIDAKDRLGDIQTFNSLNEMLNAIRELSLALRDGTIYMSPPENALQRIETVYNDLPEEAQQAFLNDHVLHRRINAARKSFNRWMGKKKRRHRWRPDPPNTPMTRPTNSVDMRTKAVKIWMNGSARSDQEPTEQNSEPSTK